jgi:hypothetical protein
MLAGNDRMKNSCFEKGRKQELQSMKQIKFLGYAAPRGTKISVQDISVLQVPIGDTGQVAQLRMSIINSQIEVELTLDELPEDYLTHLWVVSTKNAQAVLDLAAFKIGVGVIVILDTYQLPGREVEPLTLYDPTLSEKCTVLPDGEGKTTLGPLMQLVLKEPALAIALNDLILSITNPTITLINCARAVEAIRTMVAHTPDKKIGWPIMHEALNLTQEYCTFVTKHSVEHRHGSHISVAPEIRTDVTGRAWTIMDRFLHYRVSGNLSLPFEQFPVLEG